MTAQEFSREADEHSPQKNYVRGVARKQVIHHGTGWTMQGDDTPGDGSANMEAVTSPFPETDAGRNGLVVALSEIQQVYSRLNGIVGRSGPALPGGGPIGALNNFAIPGEHPFTGGQLHPADLYMSGGVPNGQIVMQATTGIPLDRIAAQFRMFGLDEAARRRGALDVHQPLRALYRGTDRAAQESNLIKLIGGVPAIGEAAAQAISSDQRLTSWQQLEFHGIPCAAKMVGFLTILALLVKTLNMATGEAAKYRMPLLIRNQVSAVWRRLDPAQQAILRANPYLLREHLLPAINAVRLYPEYMAEKEPRSETDPLVRPSSTGRDQTGAPVPQLAVKRMAGYTVGLFLDKAAVGEDDLTPDAIDAWLRNNNMPQERSESSDVFFESFGAFETDNDRILFENRYIEPAGRGVKLAVDQATQVAFDYFDYVWRATDERRARQNAMIGVHRHRVP